MVRLHDMDDSPWPDQDNETPLHFTPSETLPLKIAEPERFLGEGSYAEVDVVCCGGIPLARKRIRVPVRAKHRLKDLREGKIPKKLSHTHVVQFAGSYIQGRTIAILMWPVATCNLAQFLKAVSKPPDNEEARNICDAFDLGLRPDTRWMLENTKVKYSKPRFILQRMFGCIANAMECIHGKGVRHKDIKPSNILITPTSVYFTDFGISHDLSDLIHENDDTRTEGPYRGSAKYFSPEVARYELRGRSADIFSLGCVFLEIMAVLNGIPIEELESNLGYNREANDWSRFRYHENVPLTKIWIHKVKDWNIAGLENGFYDLITGMIDEQPTARPHASDVARQFYALGSSRHLFHGSCCARSPLVFSQAVDNFAPPVDNAPQVAEYRTILSWNEQLAIKSSSSAAKMEEVAVQMNRIAIETKRETTKMMVITLITLFFLPGTFISTLSGINIVQYSPSGSWTWNSSITWLSLFGLHMCFASILSLCMWYMRRTSRDRREEMI